MYDVIIIGSGPAGFTAAIYTTRANLKTLIIAGAKWGGQLMLTTLVENFPGFPEGIQGPDLMANMRKQAEHHGAEVIEENLTIADFSSQPFKVSTPEKTFQAKSVIIATGADTKWLGVAGEQERIGHGVSSCAPCDAPFFRNKKVIVAGGGDSAMEEALVLARASEHVIVIHRRDQLRASKIMQEKAKANPKISFLFNTEILEILGENKVEKVKVKITPSDKSLLDKPKEELEKIVPELLNMKILEKKGDSVIAEIPIDGVFVAIGHKPNSAVFKGIDMDAQGYIVVHQYYKTNVDGVFVAGDVHDAQYRQAITAAGFGCAAALESERWLRDQETA